MYWCVPTHHSYLLVIIMHMYVYLRINVYLHTKHIYITQVIYTYLQNTFRCVFHTTRIFLIHIYAYTHHTNVYNIYLCVSTLHAVPSYSCDRKSYIHIHSFIYVFVYWCVSIYRIYKYIYTFLNNTNWCVSTHHRRFARTRATTNVIYILINESIHLSVPTYCVYKYIYTFLNNTNRCVSTHHRHFARINAIHIHVYLPIVSTPQYICVCLYIQYICVYIYIQYMCVCIYIIHGCVYLPTTCGSLFLNLKNTYRCVSTYHRQSGRTHVIANVWKWLGFSKRHCSSF